MFKSLGDADVAHFAGAEYRVTDKKERMGMTTVFNCAGIDKSKFLEYTETNPATYKVSHQFFSSTMGVEFLCGNESKCMQFIKQ